ncbi:hypothetical protein ACIGEZ_25065 [Streptomyces sp. NPDC085481]|uniref:hypothetical protein n=1 Tax=Streptomyces sp. NPDC085481 TaxID=3365727 RepID=UPI0037CD7E44
MPRISEPPPEDFAGSGEEVEIRAPRDLYQRAAPDPSLFPVDLLEARSGIEAFLTGQADERNGVRSAEDLTETTNIQGVGIGRARPSDYGARGDAVEPGQWTLNVYLRRPRHPEDVVSVLVERMGVRAAGSRGVAVVPVVTGEIEAQSFTFVRRPAPGGISLIGLPNALDRGTLGCLSTGRSFPRNQRTLIISCHHVFANVNQGALGNGVIQPATADGGGFPPDLVAVLEKTVRIEFDGTINSVDCATAWADRLNVSPKVLAPGPFGPFEVPISPTTAAVTVGSAVGKSGRTTEVTSGTVQEVGASHWVRYPTGAMAYFSGSLAIVGDSGPFTVLGDSGAIVWTLDLVRNPVGLHFAGAVNGSRSFANPIDIVTQALDVFIVDTV